MPILIAHILIKKIWVTEGRLFLFYVIFLYSWHLIYCLGVVPYICRERGPVRAMVTSWIHNFAEQMSLLLIAIFEYGISLLAKKQYKIHATCGNERYHKSENVCPSQLIRVLGSLFCL